MTTETTLTTEPKGNQKKKDDSRRRVIAVILLFLLLSFVCIFCSSQSALFFVDRQKISDHMRSSQQADYGPGVPISFSRIDRDRIIAELIGDEEALLNPPALLAAGGGVAVAVLPKPTPIPTPTPVVVAAAPTPTPFPAPPTDTSPPSSSPQPPLDTVTPQPPGPTSPPPTSLPPTSSPPASPPPASPPPTSPPPTSPPPTDDNTGGGNNNTPPLANNDTATTNEDTAVVIDVLANDSDLDGTLAPGTVTVISGPANGSIGGINAATGEITYLPNPDFFGVDSFTYRVCDNQVSCSTATVTITINPVNDPPIARDDIDTTFEDIATTIDVLTNDSDPDFDPLTVISTGTPANGTVSINPGNTLTYTPTLNFIGTDTFTYTISDGALTDTAMVTVTVNPVNDPPIAVDDVITITEDTPSITITVLANDSDPEGDPIGIVSTTAPTTGSITVNLPPPTYTITYNPPLNFNGVVTFTYTISDGNLTDTATVTVNITSVNDPPVAVDDTAVINQGLSVTIPAHANDFDVDGTLDLTSVITVTNPTSGTVTTGPGAGELTYNNADLPGVDTFTYQICDDGVPAPVLCDTATITITVIDTVPVAPTNLQAAPGDSKVSLGWDHTPPADLLGYRVYRDGAFITTTPVVTRFFDTGLTNGVTYVYTVTAIDGGGNQSDPSNVASATPGAIITNTTDVTCGGITVTNCINAQGPRDNNIAIITGTGFIIFDFDPADTGQQGIIDGPGYDLVYYERLDSGTLFMDFVTLEISSDALIWHKIFEWDGVTGGVKGTSIDSQATDGNGEQQNEPINQNLLYPFNPPPDINNPNVGTNNGIAIDIGQVQTPPPAGVLYRYVRFTRPNMNQGDVAEVDAVERLN